jgi:hypothetical protein
MHTQRERQRERERDRHTHTHTDTKKYITYNNILEELKYLLETCFDVAYIEQNTRENNFCLSKTWCLLQLISYATVDLYVQ